MHYTDDPANDPYHWLELYAERWEFETSRIDAWSSTTNTMGDCSVMKLDLPLAW
jgi:hypothetical protein